VPGDQQPVDGFRRRKRYLPHWEGPGEAYLLTFALRRPPVVDLTEERYGRLVVDALRFFDGKHYDLYDYTVMPDHVHVILKPIASAGKSGGLSRITHSLKSWLAHRINELAGREGDVWAKGSYDHVLRNQKDYEEKAAYILDNARRRGLVDDPAAWPWWGTGAADR